MWRWKKKGLVFQTARHGVGGWMRHSALTPTPYRIDDDLLRVYAGFRDDDGVSRIGYVDVLADDPASIVRVSARPVLDVGRGVANEHLPLAVIGPQSSHRLGRSE